MGLVLADWSVNALNAPSRKRRADAVAEAEAALLKVPRRRVTVASRSRSDCATDNFEATLATVLRPRCDHDLLSALRSLTKANISMANLRALADADAMMRLLVLVRSGQSAELQLQALNALAAIGRATIAQGGAALAPKVEQLHEFAPYFSDSKHDSSVRLFGSISQATPMLVELLSSPSSEARSAAAGLLCDLAWSATLLCHGKPSAEHIRASCSAATAVLEACQDSELVNDACFAVSHLLREVGQRLTMPELIESNVIAATTRLLGRGPVATQLHGAAVLSACIDVACIEQIEYMAGQGCIQMFVKAQQSSEVFLVSLAEDALLTLLQVGAREQVNRDLPENPVLQAIHACGGSVQGIW